MQQRAEPDDSLDDFPTPPWATRALLEHALLRFLPPARGLIALEPCCNRGYMAKPLAEYMGQVLTSDIFDYGWQGQIEVADFLFPGYAAPAVLDLTFANPPFRLALEFIQKSLQISRIGCAMLVRTAFLEGGERYGQLYKSNPPTIVAQFAERVIMHKGILRDPNRPYWDPEAIDPKTGQKGAWKKPSTATSYCWMAWLRGVARQPMIWIPPCRLKLERPGDYPPTPSGEGPPAEPGLL